MRATPIQWSMLGGNAQKVCETFRFCTTRPQTKRHSTGLASPAELSEIEAQAVIASVSATSREYRLSSRRNGEGIGTGITQPLFRLRLWLV